MAQILPAILAQTSDEFFSKVFVFDGIAPVLHIDVMDGNFVPNTTWFDTISLNEHSFQSKLELHLMVMDPMDIVHQCEELDMISRVIWHIESPVDHLEMLRTVRHSGRQAGIAINPSSTLETISPFVDLADEVLVMGSEPGFSGKTLETRALDRVQELHMHHPELVLGFDIGVNAETIQQIQQTGVTRFCAASALFRAKNPVEMYRKLEQILK
ncbi:hypothetical protein IT408_00710 [Candidatus Uhrbacteria bacterium]|nr:hypothetical protein [Candidatus Uhrbacteria bacterium]